MKNSGKENKKYFYSAFPDDLSEVFSTIAEDVFGLFTLTAPGITFFTDEPKYSLPDFLRQDAF